MHSALFERRRFILALGALAVLIAAAFLWLSTPRYTATAQILLHWQSGSHASGNAADGFKDRNIERVGVGSQARIVASDAVLARAIAAAGLRKDEEFNERLRPPSSALTRTVLNLLGLRERTARGVAGTDTPIVHALRQRLVVTREPGTRVLNVAVYSERSDKAARIANSVVRAYRAQLVADRAARVRAVAKASRPHLADLRWKVQSAENKLAKLQADRKPAAASGPRVTDRELREVDAQIVPARVRLAQAKSSLDAARAALAHPGQIPASGASRALRDLSRRYSAVRARKARLAEQLRARHPDMLALSAQAQQLRRQIARAVGRMVKVAERAQANAQATLGTLVSKAEAMRRQKRMSAAADASRREFVRQLATARAANLAMQTKVAAAQTRAGKAGVQARIITAAIAPTKRSWPPSSLIVLPSALLVGLGLGSGLALLRRSAVARETQFASAADESRRQGGDRLPATSRSLVLADLRDVEEAEVADETMPPDKDIRAIELATTVVDEPDSLFAQHIVRLYKALRTTQRSVVPCARSLLVAPDRDAPMASAVSLGLALAGTSLGDKVLIIDGDVRHRRLSRSLLVPVEWGLQDVLGGRCKLADAVIVDASSKVAVLPLKGAAENSTTAFSDVPAMGRLLADAKAYDLVIVDGVATEISPTNRAMATAFDDLLALISLGPCSDSAADKAMQKLPDANSNLAGIVLIEQR